MIPEQQPKPDSTNRWTLGRDVAVALGGGGARGLAHIGVLTVLDREGYNVRGLAGTSIGGLIGSLYAGGMPPLEIGRMLQESWREGIFRVRPDGPGLLGLSSVKARLEEHFGTSLFSDLEIPFAVTATDLDSGHELVINSGSVVDGVMATIALPGIFSPQIMHGQRLIDGGVVDPVPVSPARALFPGPVIAVVLSPIPADWHKIRSPSIMPALPVLNVVKRFRPAQALNVFLRSMEIASRNFTELRLAVDKPEVIIRPEVLDIGLLDEPDVAPIAAKGEQAAEQALEWIAAEFSLGKRLGRGVRSVFQA